MQRHSSAVQDHLEQGNNYFTQEPDYIYQSKEQKRKSVTDRIADKINLFESKSQMRNIDIERFAGKLIMQSITDGSCKFVH